MRRSVVLVPVLLGALALAACSSPSSPTAESAVPSTKAASAARPADSTTVRLLTHDSFVVSEDLLAAFTARTGITIEVVQGGDAGAMTAGAVLAAGSPTADVLYGIDNTLVAKAVDAGVFAPYTAGDLGTVIPSLRADTAGGMVTPIDYGDVCVNVDATWFSDRGIPAPTTLDDLVKPAYRGLFATQDPATSSPGLAFLLATIDRYGADGWADYWARLKANDVLVTAGWTEAYEGHYTAGGGSDRPIVVSYATSPPAEIVYAADPKPKRPRTTVMTDGCFRQVEYAGVLAGTPNEHAAQQVVDWLLSPEVQADVPLSMFVFPAREGTPLPDVFTRFAATVPAPASLPAGEVSASLPAWLSQWDEVMGR